MFKEDEEHQPQQTPQQAATLGVMDPFEGLPFRKFAESCGEYLMPAVETLKEDMRSERGAAAARADQPLQVPNVPHFLPFTRWCVLSLRFA